MRPYAVTVWQNNEPEPYIKYVRFYRGAVQSAHERLTRYAEKRFPNYSRIKVETIEPHEVVEAETYSLQNT